MDRAYLREEERTAFRREGYLAVTGIFSPEFAEEIRRWVGELERLPEVPGRHMIYREASLDDPDRRVLDRIENFVAYHEGLGALLNDERLVGRISELLGEPVILFKEKINFKLPQSRGSEPHQDMQAGWDDYASYFITAAVAVDRSIRENGCLEVAPGWHDKGFAAAMVWTVVLSTFRH